MKVLQVNYNEDTDITKINYSNDIKSAEWITQLDVLKDAIAELTNHYNTMLEFNCINRSEYNFDEHKD